MTPSDDRDSVFDDPPRAQVLLLTCMDLRLLDDTVRFMNDFNLQNRYDHLIFAGAAMGVRRLGSPAGDSKTVLPWKGVFFHHFETAIDVLRRDIKDVFIIEHLDCGAYKYLHPDDKTKKEYAEGEDMTKLARFHRKEARDLAKEVEKFCRDRHAAATKGIAAVSESDLTELEKFKRLQTLERQAIAWKGIRARSFLMDLRAGVRKL